MIKVRSLISALLLVILLPGMAAAQAAIPDAARKRMEFYSEKALQALVALAQEDLAAEQGASLTPAKTNAMRDAMQRLSDAGRRSGLSMNQIVAYFDEQVEQRYVGPLPIALTTADGELDTRTLLAGTIGRSKITTERKVDAGLLATLMAEGDRTSLAQKAAPTPQAAEPEPEVAAEDAAFLEVAPEILLIRERITSQGDQNILVVQRGDTLGQIAQAVFGDSLRYREIYDLNRGVLPNPNSLTVGVTLVLPSG